MESNETRVEIQLDMEPGEMNKRTWFEASGGTVMTSEDEAGMHRASVTGGLDIKELLPFLGEPRFG